MLGYAISLHGQRKQVHMITQPNSTRPYSTIKVNLTYLGMGIRTMSYLNFLMACRLKELLDERGIKLFPGDERQLLMLLRAGNSDPELAVEVAKKYIAFSRYVLSSKAP